MEIKMRAKIVEYSDGTFVIRRFSFGRLNYECLSKDTNSWWYDDDKFKEFFIFKTKEKAQYRWTKYKDRNNYKSRDNSNKSETSKTVVNKWKLK